MRKLIYLSTLLLLFVLPMMAQHPLFPTPAKVQNGKGSFVIGKNLQVQGNGGYADKFAAGLQTELKEAGLPIVTRQWNHPSGTDKRLQDGR